METFRNKHEFLLFLILIITQTFSIGFLTFFIWIDAFNINYFGLNKG